MGTYLRHLVVLCAAAAAVQADSFGHYPATAIETGSVTVSYHSPGQGYAVVAEFEGLAVAPHQSIELTLASTTPTNLGVYLMPEEGEAVYRYVVLTERAPRVTLSLPREAFDPDVRAKRALGHVPKGGSLVIADFPGFMRPAGRFTASIGPCRVTSRVVPVPPEQIAPPVAITADPDYRKFLGGWTGKVVGGRLGMPLEGHRDAAPEEQPKLEAGYLQPDVVGFGPDDDTSLMLLNLLAFRQHGAALEPKHLMDAWRERFAPEYLWKTERRALLEATRGVPPLECGRGPLAGSICARIRADAWGMLFPGQPERALDFVDRDAPLSNAEEGIASAEFQAACVSAAFRASSVEEMLDRAVGVLRRRNRPYTRRHLQLVDDVLASYRKHQPLAEARKWLEQSEFNPVLVQHPQEAWAFALPNDGLVLLALLHGQGDFAKSVSIAASLGWDADCNPATVGCLLGILKGVDAIPERFTKPLDDRLRVSIPGIEHCRLSHLAALTQELARRATRD